MPRRLALLLLLAVAPASRADTPATLEFFEKAVRPLLAEHCYECHGDQKQRGGLRLDSRAAFLEGGDTGPAVVPGDPGKSLLVKAVHYKDELKMPPKARLRPEQVAVLDRWVKDGAAWPSSGETRPVAKDGGFKVTPQDRAFWSFQPVSDPPAPAVKDTAWPQTAIDRFILARLEAAGLHPAAPADRRTLIRRATFDLTGLPPTPADVAAFVADPSPDAFARVVDRLLASPHYGERQARHWLDVARYGEDQAHTFEARQYPQGFRYRDWLVQAFNADLPYDRFLQLQLAADLLDGPGQKDNLAALGLFALGPVYYGDPKKLDQYDDRIDTLTRGVLGLTVACARCHDHKFDPISTSDYYALAGVFASTDYAEVALVPDAEVEKARAAQTPEQKKRKTMPKVPFTHTLKESAKPVTMRVHVRGNPATLGAEAPRRFMTVLASEAARPFADGSGRRDLARAVADRDNPLTARVFVNRVWQRLFGKGLVRTPSNFGALGERPTHPELLDHLARRFLAAGWSVKQLHRSILLSSTYQQSSSIADLGLRIVDSNPQSQIRNPQSEDGDNRLLGHVNRRRLEVEAWRDAMLAVAGTLDPTVGGPPTDLNAADNRRRTLYGRVSRHELNPLLRLFDFPDPNITSDARTETTVPLQQLFVLNSEFMARNAKSLAANLKQAGPGDADRVRDAFLRLYARPVTDHELALGLAFLAGPAEGGLSRWEQYAQVLLAANEFLYVD